MKKILTTAFLLFFITKTYGQSCDLTILYKRAMAQIDTGYIYTKSFKLRPSDVETIDNTIVMTAGKNYHLYVESADTDPHNGILVQLRDASDKKVLVSNFDANKKILKHIISFTCKKTGIYHLWLDYSKAKIHCGVAVMSFKKDTVEITVKNK